MRHVFLAFLLNFGALKNTFVHVRLAIVTQTMSASEYAPLRARARVCVGCIKIHRYRPYINVEAKILAMNNANSMLKIPSFCVP